MVKNISVNPMRKDVSNNIMGSQRNADNHPRENYQEGAENKSDTRRASERTPSLKTLITWNVSKALKSNPQIHLRAALKEVQTRLENSYEVEALFSPDAHNLCCAFLAWQQLGHRTADSLYDFIQRTLREHDRKSYSESLRETITRSFATDNADFPVPSSRNAAAQNDSYYKTGSEWGGSAKMDFSQSIGLVVKLPVEPQAVMHLRNPTRIPVKMAKCACPASISATASKIDSACCLDKECMDRLAAVEAETKQLRKRAALFAKREAQRTELLERAEMAWRDLDAGYHRRLRLAKEKEEDYKKQTARLLEERNRYKELCTPMVNALKKQSEIAEKERERLTQLEKELCEKACARLELLKDDTRADAMLAEYQCKAAQLDRDLALKEEQEIRKQRALHGAMEAAQMLTHEAEYSQRAELNDLKAQVQQASQELLEEDARSAVLKQRIADYMEEKDELIEDLEACQTKCDARMGHLTTDLKKQRDQIVEWKEKVMECSCKEPVHRAVEVKRTPSLAALCRCSPSDSVMETCSCTSMRSRLLSGLLKDLFGGLKSEMETIGTQMPCHLLKCLEDKHNWDSNTDVKKNVRAYFSKLLLKELDLAIATVIENCHAQWVGECCADWKKRPAPRCSAHSLRWQEHEEERKTHKMATKLAEKMFAEKAQELAKQAEQILSKDGRPPCECDLDYDTNKNTSAVYRCMVQSQPVRNLNKIKGDLNDVPVRDHRRDKTIVQHSQVGYVKKDANRTAISPLNNLHSTDRSRKKDLKPVRPEPLLKNNGVASKYAVNQRHLNTRKPTKPVINKIESNKARINAPNKVVKKTHEFAVNMCLCDGQNESMNATWKTESKTRCTQKSDNSSDELSVRLSKPGISFSLETNDIKDTKAMKLPFYPEKYTCFHKSPSNTSVNRLIDILTTWKDNLVNSQESNIKKAIDTDSLFQMTHSSIVDVLKQLCGKQKTNKSVTKLKHPRITDKNIRSLQIGEKETNKVEETETVYIVPAKNFSQIKISESQYMGAINLDGKNSPFCKLRNNTEEKEQNTENPLQYIHTVKCIENQKNISTETETIPGLIIDINASSNNKDNDIIEDIEQRAITNELKSSMISHKDCEPCIKFLGVTLTNTTLKQSLSKADQKSEKPHVRNTITSTLPRKNKRDNASNRSQNEREKRVAIIPKECDNYIKFLGVALEKVNKRKLSKQDINQLSSKDALFDQEIRNDSKMTDEEGLNSNNKHSRKITYSEKRVKALEVLHLQNECTYKEVYDELNNLSVNKSVEVSDSKIDEILNKDCGVNCICCPNSEEDDLEVNTFQLLEDHLKCQLEQYKLSVCKSSCMQNANEKNLVAETLLKVKRLILETTSAVTCKCTGNTQTSGGSWQRAHILLQEYLKTKIERVKCLCDTSGQNQDENLVPRVLSKINCLIENDLQRLKNICKCKSTTPSNKHSVDIHANEMSRYMHEINDCNNETVPNTTEQNDVKKEIVGSMFGNYTNPASIPYTKSAQVSIYHSVVTRSCDALKIYNQYSEPQTTDIVEDSIRDVNEDSNIFPSVDKDYSNKVCKQDCNQHADRLEIDLTKELPLSETKFTAMSITLKSIDVDNENITKDLKLLVNEEKQLDFENINEKALETLLPYVGCTINCCCDSDLGCVCSKSAVPTSTDWWKNNNIWNTLPHTRNKTDKFSYIMSHLPSKLPEDDYSGKKSESKTNVRTSEVSANEETNIHLKKSEQRLVIVNDTANTSTEDIFGEFISAPRKLLRHGILEQIQSEFTKRHGKSNTTMATHDECRRPSSTDCDCAMVPVCHVKMLMENIGCKLAKAECTCDSLKTVCPVHHCHESV